MRSGIGVVPRSLSPRSGDSPRNPSGCYVHNAALPIVHVLHHIITMPKEDGTGSQRHRSGNRKQPIVSCLECRRMKWRWGESLRR
jgi:hypothetical protein